MCVKDDNARHFEEIKIGHMEEGKVEECWAERNRRKISKMVVVILCEVKGKHKKEIHASSGGMVGSDGPSRLTRNLSLHALSSHLRTRRPCWLILQKLGYHVACDVAISCRARANQSRPSRTRTRRPKGGNWGFALLTKGTFSNIPFTIFLYKIP